MHQVLQVTRRPAVRAKLEMAGKPQAAQLLMERLWLRDSSNPRCIRNPDARCITPKIVENIQRAKSPRLARTDLRVQNTEDRHAHPRAWGRQCCVRIDDQPLNRWWEELDYF